VVSESLPHLKRGAIRDFKNFLVSWNKWNEESWRKGDFIYTVNKSQIEFFSCDIPGKVHGPTRDILFINEANRIDWDTAQQLMIRTKKTVFYDFNPWSEFWVHTELMSRDDSEFIKSTFLDNPYLDREIALELIEAGKRNKNFRRVYIDGEIGVLEGTVFNNWTIGTFEPSGQVIYGQDYGWSKDPSTLVAVGLKGKTLYLDECFAMPGLSPEKLYEMNKHYAGEALIYGDSDEGRLIEQLRRMGLNIKPCEKGPGSITAGVSAMQDYDIVVTERSVNLIKELRNYIYLDKGSKTYIDDFNHSIDAARYAFTILNKRKYKQRW
jgi:phage terminase large subunit